MMFEKVLDFEIFMGKGDEMRALFITTNGIESGEFGGAKASIRNYNAIKSFSEADVFHIKKKSTFKSCISIMQGIFPPVLKSDVKKILSMVREKKYDFVFMDCSHFGNIVRAVRNMGVPVLVFFHNCESDWIKVRFGNKKSLRSFVYQKLVDKGEKDSAKYASYKMVFTERDRHRVEELYQTNVDAVIPIGMEDIFHDGKAECEDEKYCLLLGPLGEANIEAFSWFINEISPYLNCRTVIVGKGFEKYKEVWESKKIEVKGFVEDVSDSYNNAACVAIPLLSGGGMKIKTAEALMFGKYVFGTDEAFVGYDFDTDKVGGLCNTSKEFISEINTFLDMHDQYFNLYAREQFVDKYSIQAGVRAFGQIKEYISKQQR